MQNILPFPSRSLACQLAGEDFDPTLPHIVVHCHSQRCLSCGTTHRFSRVYECVTKGKAKTLLPIRTPSQIPVDYPLVALEIPEEPLPACHECVGLRPTRDSEAHRRWAETLKRKAEAPPAEGRARTDTGPSLDML